MKKMKTILALLFCFLISNSIFESVSYANSKSNNKSEYNVSNIILNVPHILQCGQNYSGQTLGTCSGSTICSDGCALCMICGLLKANGVNTNPGSLDTYLKTSNGYSSGCLLKWEVACAIPTSTMTFAGVQSYSLSTIKSEINAQDPVIAYVQIPQDHFITIVGFVNSGTVASDFIVQDPLYSSQRNLSQYNVVNLRVFNNVISAPAAITGSFKISNYDLTSSFIVWKSINYSVNINLQNLPGGYHYAVRLTKAGWVVATMLTNVSHADTTFGFNIPTNNSTFPNGSDYRIIITEQGLNSPVVQSAPFTITQLPTMNVQFMNGSIVTPGQPVSIQVSFPQGLSGLTGQLVAQPRKNGVPLTNLGTFPVTQTTFNFVIPSDWNGSNYTIGVSNSIAPSNAPLGYLFAYSGAFTVTPPTIINSEGNSIPLKHKLNQNYPNPFNPSTKINFDIPEEGKGIVMLTVYETSGKKVKTLVNENLNAGQYSISVNMSDFSSGVYFYTLRTNSFQLTKRFILIK